MSATTNETKIRRLIDEVWNRGDLRLLAQLYGPDEPVQSEGDHAVAIQGLRTALPDLYLEIETMVTTEDEAVARWVIHGSHRGSVRGLSADDVLEDRHFGEDRPIGLLDLHPTGRSVTVHGVSGFRFQGESVVSSWELIDRLDLARQLHALPLSIPLSA